MAYNLVAFGPEYLGQYGKGRKSEFCGKKAKLYIRVSTEEQVKKGYSVDAQLETLNSFTVKNSMIVTGIYCDEGISARKEVRKRKDLMRLLRDVEMDPDSCDYILFIKLDRWFRSVKEYYKVQEILDKTHTLWHATEEERYNIDTTNGRLNLNIRLSVNQDESDRTSDRIKITNAYQIAHGGAVTGAVGYGLAVVPNTDGGPAKKRVVPAGEKSSAVLRDLFSHYESVPSRRGCIDYIRERHGVALSYYQVTKILSNPLYKGQYRDNPNYCPAIISPAQWDHVQEIAEKYKGKKHNTKNTFIFVGLLRCPECGRALLGSTGSNGRKKYLRYRCNSHYIDKQCGFTGSIWETRVEEYLLQNLRPLLSRYLADYELSVGRSEKKPAAEIANIKSRLHKLKELYLNDLISLDDYREDYNLLNKQLAKAEIEKSRAPERDLTPLRKLLNSGFEELYNTFSQEEKRTLWASVIDYIVCRSYQDFEVHFL